MRDEKLIRGSADTTRGAGCLRWQAAGAPRGVAVLDELYARLSGDAAAVPLLRELFAAAFAPYATHLRAWLFRGAPAPAAFGAPPSALAAQIFPNCAHAGEQVPRSI